MSSDRVSATRRIAAPASRLYEIISHPNGHVEIDGSGMLDAAREGQPLTAVGDTFDMDMDREPLGDIPGMGKYQVHNTVTKFIPNQLLEWNVGAIDQPPVGHVYGWQLDSVSPTETDVTNYCDWTDVPEASRSRRAWPIIPVELMEKSVENLKRIATED